jgi:hypothetical protein
MMKRKRRNGDVCSFYVAYKWLIHDFSLKEQHRESVKKHRSKAKATDGEEDEDLWARLDQLQLQERQNREIAKFVGCYFSCVGFTFTIFHSMPSNADVEAHLSRIIHDMMEAEQSGDEEEDSESLSSSEEEEEELVPKRVIHFAHSKLPPAEDAKVLSVNSILFFSIFLPSSGSFSKCR